MAKFVRFTSLDGFSPVLIDVDSIITTFPGDNGSTSIAVKAGTASLTYVSVSEKPVEVEFILKHWTVSND